VKEGLLWYDDDPGRDLGEKVGHAARRYRRKFGAPPDACYVHPSALGGGNGKARSIAGVRVASLPSVLRHHFWLGREERQGARARQRTKN
jgi:hypothetical protein